MSKNYFQLNIPEPCDQKFSEMTPVHGGRFCDSCDKVIVDFTAMTDREIANTFKNNKGKICGQFRKSQLNRDFDLSTPSVNSYRGKAASILLSGMLTAGTIHANPPTPPIEIVDGQLILNQRDTLPSQNIGKENNGNTDYKINLLVTDETGESLIGATILHKGTESGTTTDIDGRAIFDIPSIYFEKDNNPVLEISYTGYVTQKITITSEDFNSNQTINIILNEGGNLVGEIITIGYVYKRKGVKNMFRKMKYFFKRKAENFSYFLEDRKEIREERRADRKERRAKRKARKAEKKSNQSTTPEKSIVKNKVIPLPTLQYDTKINNIFPNPFSQEINIDLTSKSEGDIEISIFDISGKRVYHATQQVIIGQQNIKLQFKQLKLNNADYLLQIKEKNGAVQSKKLIRLAED